jgi:ElaB/YqjD/DUF883 family membrane-anchored ribosome-binding protein
MEKSTNGSPSTSSGISSSSSSSKDTFKNTPHVGSQMGSDVKSTVMEQAKPAVDFLKQNFSTVQDSAREYFDASSGVIKRNPFYAMLGAAAIGVGLGMWISSRPSSNS